MKTKIINLERRTDRWETIQEEVRRFGITDFERFNAFEGGYLGFNKSVKGALEGEGELLLLEDDCVFLGGINKLYEAIKELPNDWDLLYLGANMRSPVMKHTAHLYKLHDAWTSHAIIYSDKGAKWCYEHFDPEGLIYDEWLRTVAQEQLNVFIIYPMLAIQADGVSDIWGTNVVYGIQGSSKHYHD